MSSYPYSSDLYSNWATVCWPLLQYTAIASVINSLPSWVQSTIHWKTMHSTKTYDFTSWKVFFTIFMAGYLIIIRALHTQICAINFSLWKRFKEFFWIWPCLWTALINGLEQDPWQSLECCMLIIGTSIKSPETLRFADANEMERLIAMEAKANWGGTLRHNWHYIQCMSDTPERVMNWAGLFSGYEAQIPCLHICIRIHRAVISTRAYTPIQWSLAALYLMGFTFMRCTLVMNENKRLSFLTLASLNMDTDTCNWNFSKYWRH